MNLILLFYYFTVFAFGLVIGSFLNVVIYRLEKEEKLTGRSYCPNCKHNLSWQDLIPVFSFLFLKGKCRYCGKKISLQYPLLEILTGLIFVIIFNFQLLEFKFSIFYFLFSIFSFYIASSLIVIFTYDLKHYIIPGQILFPAIIITFFYQLIFDVKFLIFNSLLASVAATAFFFSIFIFPPKGKWMGFGDVELAVLMGLLLGFPSVILALFLAFFFGAIIGIISIIFQKKSLKTQVPFAPFLILGTFIAMLFGNVIINWYITLLMYG